MTSKEGIVVGCVDESGLDQVDEVRMERNEYISGYISEASCRDLCRGQGRGKKWVMPWYLKVEQLADIRKGLLVVRAVCGNLCGERNMWMRDII